MRKSPRLIPALVAAAALLLSALPHWAAAQGSPGGNKDDLPPIASKVEGMEKIPGFFTLYRDEKKDELYAEIPGSLINKDFLIAASMSGGAYAGLQMRDSLLKFERVDNKLAVVIPDTFYTASGDMADLISRSYPDQVLATIPIVAKGGGNSALIDLKGFLRAQTNSFVAGAGRNAVLTQVTKAKSFPENTIVELTFRGRTGGESVYFNMSQLKNTGYKPRRADSRVGYFLTARNNFSRPETDDTRFDRYINRWHIEKSDPGRDLSPPKEPIVFYIEHTVPVEYRRWVREGIEMWNVAFEEIGIVNAIEVRQQTKTNEFADLDPEDVRYNFVRWIASQEPFAIAPSRTDPRTGQILDSDILFDESMARFYIDDYDLWVNSLPEVEALSPDTRQWLAENPHEYPLWPMVSRIYNARIASDPMLAGMTPHDLFVQELFQGVESPIGCASCQHCTMGRDMRLEMNFLGLKMDYLNYTALAAAAAEADAESNGASGGDGDEADEGEDEEDDKPKPHERKKLTEWPENFIGPLVREIIAHEFGHSLGLRHNFKASTWKSYEEIINTDDPNEPTTASVMDYNAFHVRADGDQPSLRTTPVIGPYDRWAVAYGYAIPGTSGFPKGEEATLKKILSRVGEPGLAYGTDEDTWSPDPLITRWDMGRNPLDYYQERLAVANQIKDNLLDITVGDGESFDRARRAFGVAMGARFAAANAAARHVGAYDLQRYYRGDADGTPPITVVSAEKQREAFQMVVDDLFAEGAFDIDPEILQFLSVSRWSHRGSTSSRASHVVPVQEMILNLQTRVLFTLTNPDRINYLYDAEFFVDNETDLFTLPEMMSALTAAIWSEVLEASGNRRYTARQPMVSNLRRNLQREYVARMIQIANSGDRGAYPAVARTLAWQELQVLGGKIDALLESKNTDRIDPYTSAHLLETRTRIQKALDANYTIGGGGGGGGFIFFGRQPEPRPGFDAMAPGRPSQPVEAMR